MSSLKEITKELMGQSLNSLHNKLNLTNLDQNNQRQTKTLQGIYTQVDNNYIEKTEQSNVIHLEGSGDGVVVLDSIEGNTMVNLQDNSVGWDVQSNGVTINNKVSIANKLKPSTQYTVIIYDYNKTIKIKRTYLMGTLKTGLINVFTTPSDLSTANSKLHVYSDEPIDSDYMTNVKAVVLEGDRTNKEIPLYFEGLQSSFEEKVNEEGKYEIEILSRNEDETKSNKIKVLLNEPLRAVGDLKDRLCIKDGKLVIERNFRQILFNGNEDWKIRTIYSNNILFRLMFIPNDKLSNSKFICDTFNTESIMAYDVEGINFDYTNNTHISINKSRVITLDEECFKEWLSENPVTVIYQLAEPYYEEVLNEYGEPIILEGYENGTLYIDSTIVPTTTVKYTAKNNTLNTLYEIDSNIKDSTTYIETNTLTRSTEKIPLVNKLLDLEYKLNSLEKEYGIDITEEERFNNNINLLINNLNIDLINTRKQINEDTIINSNLNNEQMISILKLVKKLAIK